MSAAAVLDAAEAILTDQAIERDGLESLRGAEPHHVADLRVQLQVDEAEPVAEEELAELDDQDEEAQIIQLASWAAAANRSM